MAIVTKKMGGSNLQIIDIDTTNYIIVVDSKPIINLDKKERDWLKENL